jgi:hypothetical protein
VLDAWYHTLDIDEDGAAQTIGIGAGDGNSATSPFDLSLFLQPVDLSCCSCCLAVALGRGDARRDLPAH